MVIIITIGDFFEWNIPYTLWVFDKSGKKYELLPDSYKDLNLDK